MTEVAKLRERIDLLEEEVRLLRAQLLGPELPAWLPRLTAKQRDVLRLLVARPVLRRDAAMAVLYGHLNDAPSSEIVSVFISQIRRAVGPVGIRILCIQGEGWLLPDECKRMLQGATPP